MDTNIYNLIMAITFCTLTVAAIFIPLFFSIRSSNRTDDTLKDIKVIIKGVENQTENILSEIKDSTKEDVKKTYSGIKDILNSISLKKRDKIKLDGVLEQNFTGLTNSIDNTFDIKFRKLGNLGGTNPISMDLEIPSPLKESIEKEKDSQKKGKKIK